MEKKFASRQAPVQDNTHATSPLAFALDLEVQGATFYLKMATENKNPLTKQLFYALAIEEIEHAKKIDAIFCGIQDNAGWQTVLQEKLPPVETRLKEFFARAGKTNLKADAPGTASYELAMEMEKSGYKAYTDFCDRARTDAEKEFFRQLLAEEKGHLDALANVYYYLTDTGDWLQEEESRVWNWMNI